MTTRSKRKRRGVTLMEALVTVAVMAIILPAISHALSISSNMAMLARDKSKATSLAEGKIAELTAAGTYLNSLGSGDFGDVAPGYRWSANVLDTSEAGVQELRVLVGWDDAGTQRDVTVSTLVYDSANAGTAAASAGGL